MGPVGRLFLISTSQGVGPVECRTLRDLGPSSDIVIINDLLHDEAVSSRGTFIYGLKISSAIL